MLNISTKWRYLVVFISLFYVFGCSEKGSKKPIANIENKIYQEQHRPQLHFTPHANWMNDPNGMFYYNGEYHLFYQYYPDSTVWGPMHWGHAISEDLVSWEHLPIALYPDSIGCIFSGGAVVDVNNSSNLGTNRNPPIIATFTHHDFKGEKAKSNDFQKQSIAYSLDGGKEWIKYKDNPVIPNTEKIKDFRDPKVVWHDDSEKWILVLAAYDRVKFYSSKNLLDWEFESDFAIEGDNRLWECPDLFPMKVQGSDELKWILIVSIQKEAPNSGTATSYFVGDFDGNKFTSPIKDQKWLDWGTDNYAFVTWNNVPKNDGRTLGIGWMSNWQYAQTVPTEKWRSAMTLPRELQLIRKNENYSFRSFPVKELEKLRGDLVSFNDLQIKEETALEGDYNPSQSEITLRINLNETTAESYGLKLQNEAGEYFLITFNSKEKKMYVDRTHSNKIKFSDEFYGSVHSAPVDFDKDELELILYSDAASSEIFIDKGLLSFTSIYFPSEKFNKLSLVSNNGFLKVSSCDIYQLNDIWK